MEDELARAPWRHRRRFPRPRPRRRCRACAWRNPSANRSCGSSRRRAPCSLPAAAAAFSSFASANKRRQAVLRLRIVGQRRFRRKPRHRRRSPPAPPSIENTLFWQPATSSIPKSASIAFGQPAGRFAEFVIRDPSFGRDFQPDCGFCRAVRQSDVLLDFIALRARRREGKSHASMHSQCRWAECRSFSCQPRWMRFPFQPFEFIQNRRFSSALPNLAALSSASRCHGKHGSRTGRIVRQGRRRIGRGNGTRLGDEPQDPGPDRGPRGAGGRVPCGRARTPAGHGRPRHVQKLERLGPVPRFPPLLPRS